MITKAQELTIPSEKSLDALYKRVTALNCFSLTNFNDDITSVVITFPDAAEGESITHFAGDKYFNLQTGEPGVLVQNANRTNKIIISYEDKIPASANDKKIWFTTWGRDIPENAEVKIEVINETATQKTVYTKTFSSPTKLEIKEGYLNKLSLNMTGISGVTESIVYYDLVNDVTSLKEGDEIVIAASASDAALSTTQNPNNRVQADIVKSGSTLTCGSDTQILTLEKGSIDGTFAFNTGSGYLYAASSSKNYLRTETTLSDNSSWTIEIDATGIATIKAQGTNTINWMRYNSSSKLFSCYSSGQKDVAIYKKR